MTECADADRMREALERIVSQAQAIHDTPRALVATRILADQISNTAKIALAGEKVARINGKR